jgi:LDH2 family malate/lactate/ureidoglycolate dehydrogenase
VSNAKRLGTVSVYDETIFRIDTDRLSSFVEGATLDLGFSPEDAAILARVLVTTEARGIKTHGIYHLGGVYLTQIKAGGINPKASPHVVRETATTAVIEGEGGIGQIAAVKATELAARKASESGCAMVSVRNTNHTGAIGYYVTSLADRGMVGIAAQNTPPAVAPPGAAAAVIGNQPTAYALPADGETPIVLDIAMSAAAASKINQMRQRGQAIPEGWIVDESGAPTTDPNLPFILATMGGHKGYGLSILIEAMTGLLSGGAILSELNMSDRSRPFGMSFWVTAVDVAAFMPLAEFKERIESLKAEIKRAPTVSSAAPLMLPGEPEARAEDDARKHGIRMDSVNWGSLVQLAEELGRMEELERTRIS